MTDENKLVPRENGNAVVEVVSQAQRFPSIDLSPREPHLYDYLLILRKHQWLILSFLLALQTIRNSGLIPHAELLGAAGGSEAITSGNLANHKRPSELGAFLGSLSV